MRLNNCAQQAPACPCRAIWYGKLDWVACGQRSWDFLVRRHLLSSYLLWNHRPRLPCLSRLSFECCPRRPQMCTASAYVSCVGCCSLLEFFHPPASCPKYRERSVSARQERCLQDNEGHVVDRVRRHLQAFLNQSKATRDVKMTVPSAQWARHNSLSAEETVKTTLQKTLQTCHILDDRTNLVLLALSLCRLWKAGYAVQQYTHVCHTTNSTNRYTTSVFLGI